MAPPVRGQRPAVKKPVTQTTAGRVTSTDTWNKPSANISIQPPSTHSTIPGVNLRRNGAPATKLQTNRKSSLNKPLPGLKLRPLQANNKDDDRYTTNTWDPKNKPNVPLPKKKTGVALTAAKAKLNEPGSARSTAMSSRQEASPTSRSSSVASVKPVLPGIKKKSSMTDNEGSMASLREQIPPSDIESGSKPQQVERTKSTIGEERVKTARKRDIATPKSKDFEQLDPSIDYHMPDWYKNPLLVPEPLKGGVSLIIVDREDLDWKQLNDLDFMSIYTLQALLLFFKDTKRFFSDLVKKSTLTVLLKTSDALEHYIAPSLSKDLAMKANSVTAEPLYTESADDPDTYFINGRQLDYVDNDDIKKSLEGIDVFGYHMDLLKSLGVKVASDVAELESMVVKAQKRRVNILKQERATHPNIYLEPFESDDVWNHVNTCHVLANAAFKRQHLLDQLKTAIKSSAVADNHSAVVLSGAKKTGKTWLCAQLPSLLGEEAVTVVRFCGLTSLTSSLSKLISGVSKQLSAIFGTPLISASLEVHNIPELFKLMLNDVARVTDKPVVLVLDGFDKLNDPSTDLSDFLSRTQDAVPRNVALVVSVCGPDDKSEYLELQKISSEKDLFAEVKEFLIQAVGDSVSETLQSDIILEYLDTNRNLLMGDWEKFDEDAKALQEAQEEMDGHMSLEELKGTIQTVIENRRMLVDKFMTDKLKPEVEKDTEIVGSHRHAMDSEAKSEKLRKDMKKLLESDLQKLSDLHDPDTKYEEYISPQTQHHIIVSDFTCDEARMYIEHLCQGNFQQAEIAELEKLAECLHNPLFLRLMVNRCNVFGSASSLITLFKKLEALNEEDLRHVYQQVFGEYIQVKNSDLARNSLKQALVAGIIFQRDPELCLSEDLSDHIPSIASFPDISPLKLPEATRLFILTEKFQNDVTQAIEVSITCNAMLDGCHLEVYEQNSYSHDGEAVEQTLRSGIVGPELRGVSPSYDRFQNLRSTVGLLCRQVYEVFIDLSDVFYNPIVHSPQRLIWKILNEKLQDVFGTNDRFEEEGIDEMFDNLLQVNCPHEADSWWDVKWLADVEDKGVFGEERPPVTSAKEKNYPTGSQKLAILALFEFEMGGKLTSSRDNGARVFSLIEILLQYDFLLPLLQDYGVDYVKDRYGRILELMRTNLRLHNQITQNMVSLELLYNLLVVYTPQLRENASNFYTLFLSMNNADSTLASRAALRLYKRVKHEVDIRNNLHLVTTLAKTADTRLISSNTKRYLHSTSEKYAASQCVSNASYILSHNNNDSVKLWELTGELISVQKLPGRIVCVCAQREERCFLAVLETVSEVGQKSASVWRIERLVHKKIADVGSRTILAAWFNSKGELLVLVEQMTVDEIRVVVCSPQTMQVKLEDNTISVLPHKTTTFMDKSLSVPQKVDKSILGVMKKYLGGTKEEPSELEFFSPVGGGGAELRPAALKHPLIFSSLQMLWEDILEKYDALDDLDNSLKELFSANIKLKENVHEMKITLHGMSTTGDIVVDSQFSDGTHDVLLYKMTGDEIKLTNQLQMDEEATMTLMPTDDFVYSDTGSNSGLISWHLPTNNKKIFGNEQKVHVTCLQFEVEEGQILSFTRGQVTVWNAVQKTTESSFTLDKGTDGFRRNHEIVAACLQDNWLAMCNRDGELSIRFEIRKRMAAYHFHEPIDWIDCHVIGDYLYIACHVNGTKPSICFLKYRVSDAPLYEPGKYVVRKE